MYSSQTFKNLFLRTEKILPENFKCHLSSIEEVKNELKKLQQ